MQRTGYSPVNYLVLGIAAFMLARVIFSAIMKRTPDTLQLTAEDRTAFIDVLVFLVVVLAYMFVMFGLGFWLSSLFMLALTSIYLTLEKTRRNVRMALIVPLCVCIAAYLIFTHVFYVPFPAGTWLPGSG